MDVIINKLAINKKYYDPILLTFNMFAYIWFFLVSSLPEIYFHFTTLNNSIQIENIWNSTKNNDYVVCLFCEFVVTQRLTRFPKLIQNATQMVSLFHCYKSNIIIIRTGLNSSPTHSHSANYSRCWWTGDFVHNGHRMTITLLFACYKYANDLRRSLLILAGHSTIVHFATLGQMDTIEFPGASSD